MILALYVRVLIFYMGVSIINFGVSILKKSFKDSFLFQMKSEGQHDSLTIFQVGFYQPLE